MQYLRWILRIMDYVESSTVYCLLSEVSFICCGRPGIVFAVACLVGSLTFFSYCTVLTFASNQAVS